MNGREGSAGKATNHMQIRLTPFIKVIIKCRRSRGERGEHPSEWLRHGATEGGGRVENSVQEIGRWRGSEYALFRVGENP